MNITQEFQIEINRIKSIYLSAQETFYIVKELNNQSDKDDHELYLKKMNSFFYLCKIYFWRNTVLELAKLFNEKANDKFHIVKFIGKLKPSGHLRTMKCDTEFLDQILERIAENKPLINNLIEQRDKLYAHEDRDIDGIRNIVSLNQTEVLLEICRDLIQELSNVHLDIHIDFNLINSPSQSLTYLVRNLSKLERIEQAEMIKVIRTLNK